MLKYYKLKRNALPLDRVIMKVIKKNFNNKYYFFKKYFTSENIRTIIFCVIIFILIIDSIINKTFSISSLIDSKLLFSIILLFFSDWIATSVNRYIQNKYEDYAKLSTDYEAIVKKYRLSNFIKYEFNNKEILLPYENVAGFDKSKALIVNDNKDKMYELPKQVCGCSDYIFDVHRGSVVYNNINIRLDNLIIKNDCIELFTSRTHYYDSLITNRACDLTLKDGRTIREIFEPGPYIKPFAITKMSNHIGFNGLIITSDEYIPLIVRSRNVSIAKGVLASSVSASLKTEYAVDKNTFELTVSGLSNAIRKEIFDELNIDISEISDCEIINGIKCFYRDLIECGKPQFFVCYKLPYDKDYICKCFYNSDGDKVVDNDKMNKMKRDGNEILLFKFSELLNSKLIEEVIDGKKRYRLDKIIISDKTYNITPGILLAIQLTKLFT